LFSESYEGQQQCCGLDPDSIRSLDPDPDSESGSRGKKGRKKKIIIFLKKFKKFKNTVPGSKIPPALHQESR